jgi:hypothetical protein
MLPVASTTGSVKANVCADRFSTNGCQKNRAAGLLSLCFVLAMPTWVTQSHTPNSARQLNTDPKSCTRIAHRHAPGTHGKELSANPIGRMGSGSSRRVVATVGRALLLPRRAKPWQRPLLPLLPFSRGALTGANDDGGAADDDDVRMVAAATEGGLVIGRGGQLPWDLPEVGRTRDRDRGLGRDDDSIYPSLGRGLVKPFSMWRTGTGDDSEMIARTPPILPVITPLDLCVCARLITTPTVLPPPLPLCFLARTGPTPFPPAHARPHPGAWAPFL